MTAYCILCQKAFRTEEALLQHKGDSPAHKQTHCTHCNKAFPTAEALAQHTRDSPAHQHSSTSQAPPSCSICTLCNRPFISADALTAHIQASPRHLAYGNKNNVNLPTTTTTTYTPNSRGSSTPVTPSAVTASHYYSLKRLSTAAIGTTAAAVQPQPQPTTTKTLPCTLCARTFATPAALAQHMHDAPLHADRDSGYFSARAVSAYDEGPQQEREREQQRFGDAGGYVGGRRDSLVGDGGGVLIEGSAAAARGLKQKKDAKAEEVGSWVEKGIALLLEEAVQNLDEDDEEEGDGGEEDVKVLVRLLLRRLRLV